MVVGNQIPKHLGELSRITTIKKFHVTINSLLVKNHLKNLNIGVRKKKKTQHTNPAVI